MPKTTTPRRAPTQARGARRIEVILSAAAELFDDIGYDATSTVLIAQHANTAVGSLYDFFPNKESIAQTLVARFTDDLRTLLDSLINKDIAHAPLEQVLDGIIDPLVAFISTRPGFKALYLKSPQVGQASAGQQALENIMADRMTTLIRVRYPDSNAGNATRIAKVCIEVVKALTGLAIISGKVERAIIRDLKTMLLACITSNLETMP